MQNLLTDILGTSIDDDFYKNTGQSLGVEKEQTKSVVSKALPFLLSALAKNTSTKEGANELSNVLKKDHNGDVFNNLGSLISNPESGAGKGILKHVLGGSQSKIEDFISQKSGIDKGNAGKILQILAPMVMGSLGKMQKEGKLNVNQLSGVLKVAGGKMDRDGIMGIAVNFLDKNGDGDIKDDLFKMGMKWLSGKFGEK